MGDFEAATSVAVESPLRYHPGLVLNLTYSRYPGEGQYLTGSLTGAVASQNVTEAFTKVG